MPEFSPTENDFLRELTAIVEKNISDERFGVSELAGAMNMSRSNLLRKVKKETKLSVSQLISQVRLKRAMELLRKTSSNVSEVSHQVGFNSTSYFIKCFREYYGYPPGEVGKREAEGTALTEGNVQSLGGGRKRKLIVLASLAAIVALVVGFIRYNGWTSSNAASVEKSIAVLPFKNESNDSTNIYLINGLMEATLSNLQQIKDLRVMSRTSSEKYRNTTKSIPEIAKELNVKYFVEGSGQKIGDRILLTIQLIDASSDRHLWSKQYRKESKDIFELQEEIAKNIADEIQVIITPEVQQRIEKAPTDDLVAYDYYLKGKDLFYKSGPNDLLASIPWFNKAIEQDPEFALAYANLTMVHYYLDIFQLEKKYSREIASYADKAMLFDPRSGESLVAKALAYAHVKDYESAIPFLEKAFEYNPNNGLVLHFLTEFYNIYVPNPGKYLEYALLKVRIDKESPDSATTSFNYFHLANAYLSAGFLDEAEIYIDKSLAFNPNSYFGRYVKIFIPFAKDRNVPRAKQRLLQELKKDTMAFALIQEMGKLYFMERDYEGAYRYYKKFNVLRDSFRLDLYKTEDLKIAVVYDKVGRRKEAEKYLASFKNFADNDRTIYKHAHLAMYYCYKGENQKALDHLKLFAREDNFLYWILFIDDDPEADKIKDDPEFKKVVREIKKKFWDKHDEIRERLTEKGLI